MNTGLTINIIVTTILFLIYLYIYLGEKNNFMGVMLLSDAFTFIVVPFVLFLTNLILFITYREYMFLLFMAVIFIPVFDIASTRNDKNKNQKLIEIYSMIIIDLIQAKIPEVKREKIIMTYNAESNYVKIIIKNNDIEFDYYKINKLKNQIEEITALNVDLFLEEENEA